jgi:hypothetical protein
MLSMSLTMSEKETAKLPSVCKIKVFFLFNAKNYSA